jgi:peptidoglycan/LPS O-acetylase OafA/YrhL
MSVFVLAAGMIAVFLFVAGARRPRIAVFVAAILWGLYAYYESLILSGVLCDANCNIRVDLVLFFPILGIATVCAYRSYERPPGPPTFGGMVLGAIGLIILALLAAAFGYIALAWVVGAVALAIGAYAVKSRYARSVETPR